MREKVIAGSVVCCFFLGVYYLKNKVFSKKRIIVEEGETEVDDNSKEEANQK